MIFRISKMMMSGDRAADKFDEWLDTQEFEGFDIEE